MKKLTITAVRQVCEQHDARQAIVVLFDDRGRYAVTSYGATKTECAIVAKTCDDIAEGLATGKLRAPR